MSTARRLTGLGVCGGIGFGTVYNMDRRRLKVPRYHIDEQEREAELQRFEQAISISELQLEELKTRATESGLKQVSMLLEAHAMVLRDDALRGATRERIVNEGQNAEWALKDTVRQIKQLFDRLEADYFKERRSDVDIVGDRLMRNLVGKQTELLENMPQGAIVVAYDLTPADTVALARNKVVGFVTEAGGRTSHTAIMARALDVPCVLGVSGITDYAGAGDSIIVDGGEGEVVLRPDSTISGRYQGLQKRRDKEKAALLADRALPAETTDGVKIELYGNVEVSSEIETIVSYGGEGVGLYRTEFLQLERPGIDSSREHHLVYREMLGGLKGRRLVIRTIDEGGDKQFEKPKGPMRLGSSMGVTMDLTAQAAQNSTQNPALGLRSIRISLKNRKDFREQLKGILMASAHGTVKLLIPFITNFDEIISVKKELQLAKDELRDEGADFDENIPFGVMIETPAAVTIADLIAKEVDFLSVGTNDLIQYVLAADRTNEEVSYLYRPCHPAILRMLKQLCQVTEQHQIGLTICGEVAADPFHAPILIGLGVKQLSMTPYTIPVVKRMIRRLSYQDCKDFADQALALHTATDVEINLAERLAEWTPDLMGLS